MAIIKKSNVLKVALLVVLVGVLSGCHFTGGILHVLSIVHEDLSESREIELDFGQQILLELQACDQWAQPIVEFEEPTWKLRKHEDEISIGELSSNKGTSVTFTATSVEDEEYLEATLKAYLTNELGIEVSDTITIIIGDKPEEENEE